MHWRQLPIIAFDTETTGLEPFGGDRIIEVALVVLRLDDSMQIASTEEHSWLVNPGIPIPQAASRVTGLTDADVANAPRFEEVAEQVFNLLGSGIIVAHNLPFDVAFLTKELREAGMDWPEPIAEIDTLDLSYKHFSEARTHKLGDVCARLDVRLDGAHRATNDALACGQVFQTLARRHGVADDLQALLDWGNAIGRPPEAPGLRTDSRGHVVFTEGPHRDEHVVRFPVHLAWMEKARIRTADGWQYRYTESVRRWIRRWLDVRASGRRGPGPKGFRSEDWALDPCVLPLARHGL